MGVRPSVLVTGGAGYIGSHCCKALNDAGYDPVCYDNLATGHEHFVKWGPLIVADIRDTETLASAMKTHNAIAVMHFAASSLVGESVIDPHKYYMNNVVGTISLLQAMQKADCSNIIFSSTGAVYGNASRDPIQENSVCLPVNPYGSSKLMVEKILADYCRAYQFRSISLRYFNACGADLSGVLGEFRDHETHLIPRAMMAILGRVRDFSVFGDDYDTPDGTAIRDYIHVTDLATAHLSALEALKEGHSSAVYNLGTGKGCSVKEILAAISAVTGEVMPTVAKGRRVGDPPILVADPSAAYKMLNFRPIHSNVATIIRSAWIWHQKAHGVSSD